MMNPRVETYQILKKASSEDFENVIEEKNIHTVSIPEGEIKQENLPLVRINSMRNNPDDFASNNPITYEQMVAISIWDTDVDKLDSIAETLEVVMDSNEWVLYRNFDVVEDTETDGWFMLHHRYRKTKLNK